MVFDNLGSVKEMLNSYIHDSLFKKPKLKPKISYGKKNIQIGRRVSDGSIYSLNVEEAFRMLVLGLTRSGKTFTLRSMMSRMKKIGFDVVYLSDVKNEFFTNNYPVQDKFVDGLLPGEKPFRDKTVVLRPTFFKQISKKLQKLNFWYSVDMNELSRADFMTLMNVNEMTTNQKTALELIYQELHKRLSNGESFSIDLIYDIIDSDNDIEDKAKKSLKFKFKPLEFSFFYEPEFQRSIVALIKKGYSVSFNLENFDQFGKGSFLFPEVTLNIVLREIVSARRKKEIKKLWIIIDEASRFIGKSKRNSVKDSVEESYELDSRYGINYCSAYQSWSDIPDKILSNTRYILVPRSADTGTIKSVLNNTGLVKNVQRSLNRAMELKRLMKKHDWSWLIIDRMELTYDIITFLPPLTMHLESTK